MIFIFASLLLARAHADCAGERQAVREKLEIGYVRPVRAAFTRALDQMSKEDRDLAAELRPRLHAAEERLAAAERLFAETKDDRSSLRGYRDATGEIRRAKNEIGDLHMKMSRIIMPYVTKNKDFVDGRASEEKKNGVTVETRKFEWNAKTLVAAKPVTKTEDAVAGQEVRVSFFSIDLEPRVELTGPEAARRAAGVTSLSLDEYVGYNLSPACRAKTLDPKFVHFVEQHGLYQDETRAPATPEPGTSL